MEWKCCVKCRQQYIDGKHRTLDGEWCFAGAVMTKEENGEFFDDNDKYRQPALDLDLAAANAVKPLFETYAAAGYSIRQISYIISMAVRDQELMAIIDTRRAKKPGMIKYRCKQCIYEKEVAPDFLARPRCPSCKRDMERNFKGE